MKNEKVLESIAEGQELIAQFMGYDVHDYNLFGESVRCYSVKSNDSVIVALNRQHVNTLKYNTSWDWLMPVINRISDHIYEEVEEDNGLEKRIIKDRAYPRTFGMISQDGKYMFRFNRQILFEGETLIDAAFLACVDFITWYKSCGGAIDSKTSHETSI